jgi:uncharacterized protein (DUF488 family)
MTPPVWTIGHSTHPPETFVELLRLRAIQQVADIRSVPRSRRHPQFERDALTRWLPERGISYAHLGRLGGWKRPEPDSPNGAWRNRSFRGYADYALGGDFARGVAELVELAADRRTAMMCSEALWWRCHRRLVADRIVVAGGDVQHIGSDGRLSAHALTSFAFVGEDGRITYPPVSRMAAGRASAPAPARRSPATRRR